MGLIRSGLLNSIAVMTKMLVGFILNKILAIYVGPAGYAVIGQYQNVVSMVNSIVTGSVNNGVVRYTAEYRDNPSQRFALWRTAVKLCAGISISLGLMLMLLQIPISRWLLGDPAYHFVIMFLGLSLLFFSLNTILLGVLNGMKELKYYVIANVSGSLMMLAASVFLIRYWGLKGALAALSINQAAAFFTTLAVCWQRPWFLLGHFLGTFDRTMATRLGSYLLMALVSAIVVPLSQITVRQIIAHYSGWTVTGYWQAVWKMSELYLSFLTATMGVYYLPKIAEIQDRDGLRRELGKMTRAMLPVVMTMSMGIYILREPLTILLFTRSFLPMQDLFPWQLAGDSLKILGWLLGYIAWGRALVGLFLFSEVFFSGFLVLSAWVGVRHSGAKGATMAYFVTYLAYVVFMYAALRRKRQI